MIILEGRRSGPRAASPDADLDEATAVAEHVHGLAVANAPVKSPYAIGQAFRRQLVEAGWVHEVFLGLLRHTGKLALAMRHVRYHYLGDRARRETVARAVGGRCPPWPLLRETGRQSQIPPGVLPIIGRVLVIFGLF